MSEPKNWWLGVIPLLIIWLVANFVMTEPVESELAARASAAVATASPILDKPSVTIAGRDATLAGTTFTTQGLNDAVNAADRAYGIRLARNTMTVVASAKPHIFDANVNIKSDEISPYILVATKSDGALKLTGYFPDEQAHKDLLAAISRRFFDSKLTDELTTGKGAPKDFAAAVAAMLRQLSRLASGTGTISDQTISIKGDAFYAKAAADIPTELAGSVPQNYTATASVGVAPLGEPVAAAACQPLFANILGQGKILFETGRTAIDKESAAVLDKLTSTTMRCPDADIEISGHTDSVGSDATNMQLSRRRAEAVSDYLVNAGIAATRLTAVGYGETRPIAANDTEEGRAQNRRIEFEVK